MEDVTGMRTDAAPERRLQATWYDGLSRPIRLHTRMGESVRVIDPGVWNLEAGPDFLNATLEIAGRRVVGDVEIHRRPQDWRAHGHERDPAYAHVVVHATGEAGHVAGLPEGCFEVVLGDAAVSAEKAARYPFGDAVPAPCNGALSAEAVQALLHRQGETRLRGKSARMAERLATGTSPPLLFREEILAAFGYKHNAAPFRALASIVPWKDLPPDADAIAHCLLMLAEMKVEPKMPFRRANVRPANDPRRRLRSYAALEAADPFRLLDMDGDAAVGFLRQAGLGRSRAASIFINAVVPFALATGRRAALPRRLPPEEPNAVTRRMAWRLFGPDHNPALYSNDGILQQGLIHLYRTCCETVPCDACPVFVVRD